MTVEAAGLCLGLALPEEWIDPAFLPFSVQGQPEALIRLGQTEELARPGGTSYSLEEEVTFWPDGARMLLREPGPVVGVMLRLHGALPEIIAAVRPGAEPDPAALMDAVKGAVCLLYQQRGVYLLHSASVMLDGRVYAFSAPSGTGKSTHAALWKQGFGAEDFNGDLLALRAGEIPVLAHGVPWSGSSGITRRGSLPFGGLFFLERAAENSVAEVKGLQKLLLLSQRLFADTMSPGALGRTLHALSPTASALPCAILRCNREPEAAQVAVAWARAQMRSGR